MDTQKVYEEALQKIQILEEAIEEYKERANELSEVTKSLETQIYRIKKDKDGEYIIIFNEGKIAEKYKTTTERIKGEKIKDIIGKRLYAELKPYYDTAFNGETVKYDGFIFNECYFSTVLSPFKRGDDGTVIEISGNTQDISELYLVKKKFKEKTEVLNNIIEYNPYSIQICDANGYQITNNNAFLKIFITQPSQEWSLFNDPLLKQMGVIDEILKVKNGEIIELPEVWYNSHDIDSKYPDNLRCLRAIHFPIYNIKHELENIIIMHEDITSRMALKKRVKELEEFHDLTVGRESKMKSLEEELEGLRLKIKNKNN